MDKSVHGVTTLLYQCITIFKAITGQVGSCGMTCHSIDSQRCKCLKAVISYHQLGNVKCVAATDCLCGLAQTLNTSGLRASLKSVEPFYEPVVDKTFSIEIPGCPCMVNPELGYHYERSSRLSQVQAEGKLGALSHVTAVLGL